MMNRLFGRKNAQPAKRYSELAAGFQPSRDLDPCTLELMRLARDKLLVKCGQDTPIVNSKESIDLWQNEIFRLLIDGFLAGRIEDNREREYPRFDQLDGGGLLDMLEFALIADRATTRGIETGYFSSQPSPQIGELLRSFVLQAASALFDHTSNSHRMGEALGKAVNIGREIALLEGYYFIPSKRNELNDIRATISEEEKQSMHAIVDKISESAGSEPRVQADTVVDYLRSRRS